MVSGRRSREKEGREEENTYVVHSIGCGLFWNFPQAETYKGHLVAGCELDGRHGDDI